MSVAAGLVFQPSINPVAPLVDRLSDASSARPGCRVISRDPYTDGSPQADVALPPLNDAAPPLMLILLSVSTTESDPGPGKHGKFAGGDDRASVNCSRSR
jgi:hypothetical protein